MTHLNGWHPGELYDHLNDDHPWWQNEFVTYEEMDGMSIAGIRSLIHRRIHEREERS